MVLPTDAVHSNNYLGLHTPNRIKVVNEQQPLVECFSFADVDDYLSLCIGMSFCTQPM